MILRKISIFQYQQWPLPPFRIKIHPSHKTSAFLTKLFKEGFFQNKIAELKSKYGIPENGYKTSLLKDFKQPNVFKVGRFKLGTYDIHPLWLKMREECWALATHFDLNGIYGWYFFLLITHNAFIESYPEDHIDIMYDSGKKSIEATLKYTHDPVAVFFIKSHITKQQFKNWIDQNWAPEIGGNINIIMPKFPKEKGTYLNAALDEEIYILKQQGKTYKQIISILSRKYPTNDNIYGNEWLKVRYSRYKQKKLK